MLPQLSASIFFTLAALIRVTWFCAIESAAREPINPMEIKARKVRALAKPGVRTFFMRVLLVWLVSRSSEARGNTYRQRGADQISSREKMQNRTRRGRLTPRFTARGAGGVMRRGP